MPTIIRLRDIKKEKDSNTNRSAKYYNSKGWRILRNSYIRSHPLCERCLSKDIVTPAEHVHHIVPFLSGNGESNIWKLLLDEGNLMSLCAKCHKEIHK